MNTEAREMKEETHFIRKGSAAERRMSSSSGWGEERADGC